MWIESLSIGVRKRNIEPRSRPLAKFGRPYPMVTMATRPIGWRVFHTPNVPFVTVPGAATGASAEAASSTSKHAGPRSAAGAVGAVEWT
jgi:hypothetical protein